MNHGDKNPHKKVDAGVFAKFNQVINQLKDYFKNVHVDGRPDAGLVIGELVRFLEANPNANKVQQGQIVKQLIQIMDKHIEDFATCGQYHSKEELSAAQAAYRQQILAGLDNKEAFPETEAAQNIITKIKAELMQQYAEANDLEHGAPEDFVLGEKPKGEIAIQLQRKLFPGAAPNKAHQDDAAPGLIDPKADVADAQAEEIKIQLPGANSDAIDKDFLARMVHAMHGVEAPIGLDKEFQLEVFILMPKFMAFSKVQGDQLVDQQDIDWAIKQPGTNVFPIPVYYNEELTWAAIARYCDVSPERYLKLLQLDDGSANRAVKEHVIYRATVTIPQIKLQFEESAGNNYITLSETIAAEKTMAWGHPFPQMNLTANPTYGQNQVLDAVAAPHMFDHMAPNAPKESPDENADADLALALELSEQDAKQAASIDEDAKLAAMLAAEDEAEKPMDEDEDAQLAMALAESEKIQEREVGREPGYVPGAGKPRKPAQNPIPAPRGGFNYVPEVPPRAEPLRAEPPRPAPRKVEPRREHRLAGGLGAQPPRIPAVDARAVDTKLMETIRKAVEVCAEKGSKSEKQSAQEFLASCEGKTDVEIRHLLSQRVSDNKNGGWSENSCKGLLAWHVNHDFELGFEKIRSSCRRPWGGNKVIAAFVAKLEETFPDAEAALAFRG